MDFDSAMLLAIPASFILFLGLEALIPSGRSMPQIRHWRLIGLAWHSERHHMALAAAFVDFTTALYRDGSGLEMLERGRKELARA